MGSKEPPTPNSLTDGYLSRADFHLDTTKHLFELGCKFIPAALPGETYDEYCERLSHG